MTVRTNTRQFEASHGRKPKGYGLWWFDVEAEGLGWAERLGSCTATGTYTEAQRAATKHARALAADRVPEGVKVEALYLDVLP